MSPAKKKKSEKRSPRGKYAEKLTLGDGVTFDKTFAVAINHDRKKKAPAKKKK